MAAFDLLHPALRHHIVNSLGWREMRPFQEEVIPVVLRGDHTLVIAPTAGGKTEAAIFPVLSRMLTEDWRGLSVLYICPIKALLNNLQDRLERYATLLGRSCAVWHGDVGPSARKKVGHSPPDILLTTPESLELMLVSTKTDRVGLFARLQVVIVDELHAFAGDDRGWHLLSVLQRVSRLAGREVQRIGLSATIGNPEALLAWLVAGGSSPARVVQPPAVPPTEAQVQLDHVGSVANAAVVISRLHRGEKRLVFVDSRARAEELGTALRQLGIKAHVTHSSLSREQRQMAEAAFATDTDCVIVATSVLELGVDVGSLDRVIQLDAPGTVASFLQRMGRTGRRPGSQRNCLFLATNDHSLLQAAALLELWDQGYVEAVVPPPKPYHVFVQQLLALVLQEQDLIGSDWIGWIGSVPAFAAMADHDADQIISHALATKLLMEDGGRLLIGPEAEAKVGFRNFSSLLSVITSRPLVQVCHGRAELGFVDPMSFMSRDKGLPVLSLGGRGWQVTHIDWNRQIAYVTPTELKGRSRWTGSSVPLSRDLCQSVRRVLGSSDVSGRWSTRAKAKIAELRGDLATVCGNGTVIVNTGSAWQWWTFAGLRANATLAALLQDALGDGLDADNFSVTIPLEVTLDNINLAISTLRKMESLPTPTLRQSGGSLLKFVELLPDDLVQQLLGLRLADIQGAQAVLACNVAVQDAAPSPTDAAG